MSTLSVDTIQGKTTAGTVAMPSGHVIQVQRTYTANSGYITASTTSLAASGIQCSITPKFSNSLILVDFVSSVANSDASDHIKGRMYLKIGSASIAQMSGANQYHLGLNIYNKNRYGPMVFSGSYTATSTDTLMFEPYIQQQFGNNNVYLVQLNASSSLTVTEIKQ